MIDFHLKIFLDHQNLGLTTKVVWLQSYDMFNICSLIMLIYAN